jgi:hypothetical protein
MPFRHPVRGYEEMAAPRPPAPLRRPVNLRVVVCLPCHLLSNQVLLITEDFIILSSYPTLSSLDSDKYKYLVIDLERRLSSRGRASLPRAAASDVPGSTG